MPTPIAARYKRDGMFYRADIITQRIENSESLAARLAKGPLPLTQWIAIGRCIRRFHDAGVHHADLNAHNILLTPEQVYLIDFDRGTLRKRGWWADTTLVRLYRSLEKVTLIAAPESGGTYFNPSCVSTIPPPRNRAAAIARTIAVMDRAAPAVLR